MLTWLTIHVSQPGFFSLFVAIVGITALSTLEQAKTPMLFYSLCRLAVAFHPRQMDSAQGCPVHANPSSIFVDRLDRTKKQEKKGCEPETCELSTRKRGRTSRHQLWDDPSLANLIYVYPYHYRTESPSSKCSGSPSLPQELSKIPSHCLISLPGGFCPPSNMTGRLWLQCVADHYLDLP